MSYVPRFETDIFISYAHIDDQPLAEGQKGWVQSFHRSLQIRLQQLLGAELSVWRDEKLQGNDYFGDALTNRFPRIAILVSILSPRYLQSEWCLKELREFVSAAERTGGVRLSDRSRIFKVVKTHVPREQHPRELQGLLGYEFYQLDPGTGRPREFLLDPRDDAARSYWAKLEDVAYDIHEMLKTIREPATDASSPAVASGLTVYLAEATSALEAQRTSIHRELKQRGHQVVPDRPLPLEGAALRQAVRDHLTRAHLSIHLIGGTYGLVPEGETESTAALQLHLAAEPGTLGARPRLVWLPPAMVATDERQRALIAFLRDQYSERPGVDLLETPLEEFKTFIQDRLAGHVSARPSARPERSRRVYIVCDVSDHEAVRAIEDHLYGLGLTVILPATEGDETQLREDHKANLVDCDGVLIVYAYGSELWLRAKLRDLDKVAGYGRTTAFRASAVYVTAPPTPTKERFRTHDTLVIKNFGAFASGDLADFLVDLNRDQPESR